MRRASRPVDTTQRTKIGFGGYGRSEMEASAYALGRRDGSGSAFRLEVAAPSRWRDETFSEERTGPKFVTFSAGVQLALDARLVSRVLRVFCLIDVLGIQPKAHGLRVGVVLGQGGLGVCGTRETAQRQRGCTGSHLKHEPATIT